MSQSQFDVLIVGAGPAGVQLGYYLQKTGIRYLILEQGSAAGESFKMFPVHRKLISINKIFTGSTDPEFNMRHDWNSLLTDDYGIRFPTYDEKFFPDADNLVKYLADYVSNYSINVQYNTPVASVSREGEIYSIIDAEGNTYTTKNLVIATGFKKPMTPKIPGIEHSINYVDLDLETRKFENKRVLVLGKGNSGFETADYLIPYAALIHIASPNPIKMAWKTHYVGNLRAVNNNLLDTYQLKSQNAVLDAQILNIEKLSNGQLDVTVKYGHAEGEVEVLRYDYVIACTGFKFDGSIFEESAIPELCYMDKFPAIKPNFESVNCPGMYFAGTITHSLDYKKATSGFIHGFRYNCRYLFNMLNEKIAGVPYPHQAHPKSARLLVDLMLDRVNRAAGLWQQAGFMTDVFVVENGQLVHYKEMPKPFVMERFDSQEYFTLNLEYGDPIEGDPFNVERIHRTNTEQAQRSQFLHPVVRRYAGAELLSRHDIIEDLEANWVEPEHINPLLHYLKNEMKETTATIANEMDIELAN